MIKPVQQGKDFLAEIQKSLSAAGAFHVWWLGQSGFLLQWEGRHLLMDPYLSDSLTKKYAATEKPHVRMTEQVIQPAELDFIDVVTSSHNHTDHLDGETLKALFKVNPKVDLVIPEANREFVANRLNIVADIPIGLDAGQSVELKGFTFHGIPAAHESIEKDESGRCLFLGYVVEFGGHVIYHSGDTVRYPGMADLLQKWRIDIAFLPINGRAPERRVAGNLDGIEAARLARDAGVRCVVPCHYEMFAFNTAEPGEFVSECKLLGQACHVLRAGERLTIM
ncbi:MAG: MBL fold metallo-hydrolase [Verrucomicrobiota bacterium]|nr:MBL fold metallo-hydrolase [Verrucomicrobiota bacterium]